MRFLGRVLFEGEFFPGVDQLQCLLVYGIVFKYSLLYNRIDPLSYFRLHQDFACYWKVFQRAYQFFEQAEVILEIYTQFAVFADLGAHIDEWPDPATCHKLLQTRMSIFSINYNIKDLKFVRQQLKNFRVRGVLDVLGQDFTGDAVLNLRFARDSFKATTRIQILLQVFSGSFLFPLRYEISISVHDFDQKLNINVLNIG